MPPRAGGEEAHVVAEQAADEEELRGAGQHLGVSKAVKATCLGKFCRMRQKAAELPRRGGDRMRHMLPHFGGLY